MTQPNLPLSPFPVARGSTPTRWRLLTLSLLMPNPRDYSIALGDLVVELTQTGLNYYFGQPLRDADAGFVLTKTADVGTAATLKVMAPVIRNVIGQLSDDQIRAVSVHAWRHV